MWLLYLSSCTVFSHFCTICLASSPTIFPSIISISYRRMLRVSRSSTVGISLMWTSWNWLGLTPAIILMIKLNNFEVSPSSRSVPCKWRTRARKRHKLLLYGCLVFSSYVRQLILPFFNRGSVKTAFLDPIGTSLRRTANTVKFVSL